MADTYLFAFANLLLCGAIGFISICRLNAMEGNALRRVQSEYAAYLGASFLSAFQPWFGEWPGWASLGMAGAVLIGLLSSGHTWRHGTPAASSKD